MKSLVLVLLFVCSLFAHKVNLFITNEGDTIDIYSYFASGTACQNCKLIIKNNDQVVLKGILDEKGKYTYIPEYKNIEVIIDATGGHIAKEKISVQNVQKQNIEKYKEKEKIAEYKTIILGLIILFVFFFLLKRFIK